MEKGICKVCLTDKDIKKFARYITSSGRELRQSTCHSCYNNKYNPWTKKTYGESIYDSRFKWEAATEKEKVDHLKKIFEDSVIKKEGCWDWNRSLHRTGYAVMKWGDKQIGAHRASVMIFKRMLNDGEWVLHTCDNKKCTNPDHLYIGTPQENSIDREVRNRRKKIIGKDHPNAVLNERKVRNIKELLRSGKSVSELAKKYKCGTGTIAAIKLGLTWKHVQIN